MKAFNAFGQEQKKQLSIIFPAACVVLWKDFGFRTRRIAKILNSSYYAIKDIIATDGRKSAIELLDEETGIVLTIPGRDEYSEYRRLSRGVLEEKKGGLTGPELVYFYQRLSAWCAPQAIACLCIALHREERFGYGKLNDFIHGIDEIRQRFGEDPKKYKKLLAEETDIDPETICFW